MRLAFEISKCETHMKYVFKIINAKFTFRESKCESRETRIDYQKLQIS